MPSPSSKFQRVFKSLPNLGRKFQYRRYTIGNRSHTLWFSLFFVVARRSSVSKEEHLVTEECLVDLIEGCIIQLCQVDALNLSTDVGGQCLNLDPIELHCSFLAHQPPAGTLNRSKSKCPSPNARPAATARRRTYLRFPGPRALPRNKQACRWRDRATEL